MAWIESPQWPLEDKLFQGQSNHDIPSYFREVKNRFQCKAVLDLHVCVFVRVCLYQKHFYLSSKARWNVYNSSSICIYLHDGAGRFTVLSFIAFDKTFDILSVYLCRRQLWYDSVSPGYSQQQLQNYFCYPFSPFSPLLYILHSQILACVCFLMGGVGHVILGWFN